MEKRQRIISFILISIATIGIVSSVALLGKSYLTSVQMQVTHPVRRSINTDKRVLFISSYSDTQETVLAQLAGINSVFDKKNIYFDVEYMDMKNYNTAENVALFYDRLRYKLSHHERYDAILLGDDAALDFALQYQTELFFETPMVFMGINDLDRARHAAENPYVTGVAEVYSFSRLIDVAIKLNPMAKKIVAIYDTAISGLGDEKQFFSLRDKYPHYLFRGIKTSDYSRFALGEQISKLTNDSIVLCLSAYEDKDGQNYTIAETAQFVYSYARVPVYTKLYNSVGKGFTGGYIFDFEGSARYAAEDVEKILHGKKTSDIPLFENIPSLFYFDYMLIRQFNLDITQIPKDAIIANKQHSYWKQYRLVLIPFIIITLSLILLLAFVFYYVHQLKLTHNVDSLTRLPNRDIAQAEVRRLLHTKTDFSVVMLDIEGLKSVNDFYSSACGDFVLRELAKRLTSIGDLGNYMVARYGSDEFVLVWKGNHLHKNSTVLFLLKQLIAAPFEYNENQIFIKTSIGIANYTGKDDTTVDEYFSNADSAMAEAKKVGKNKSVFFTTEMREAQQTKQEIAKILEKACNREDGFYVLYQPQVDVATGEIHGYEALCRLKTVKIFPGQFIPVAEESGLMAKIGRIVTEQVIKQMAEWKRTGFPLRKVSINYSAAQMADKEYPGYLKSLLDKNGISPSLIEIEITESLFMGNRKLASELANDFRAIGIKLALDDFGTGYSSLSYLTYIPVETIKLDKTLVDAYLQEGKESFIENIINLVHSLNMKLIIEGVEQKWQYEMLKKLKGDIIQGYYFSKPIPAKEVETFKPVID